MKPNAQRTTAPSAPGRGGFTLTEILVALSIFLVLGSMLVLALGSGVDTWRATEDRRILYEQAQMVLEQIENDLANVALPRPGEDEEVRVRFLADYDANNRARLRFVRTLPGENVVDEFRAAGTAPPDVCTEVLQGHGEPRENLQPLEGLMEVVYLLDPDPDSNVLYRGVRSPIGGEGSLFRDKNIDEHKEVLERCTPVADGVLYLGYLFWTQYTTTWDLKTALSDTLGAACGPEVAWDSTRGVLPPPRSKAAKNSPNRFWLAVAQESENEPSDDVFPRQIQIQLNVVTEGGGLKARLVRSAGKGDSTLYVDSASGFATEDEPDLYRYLRVGHEWVYYDKRTSRSFSTRGVARGARGTRPEAHEEGDVVYGGRTFVLTVKIPSHRGFWQGEGISKILSRHAPPDPPWAGRSTGGSKEKDR